MIDSLDLDDARAGGDRAALPRRHRELHRRHPRHRHDGRDRRARWRRPDLPGKTIVLTGAMVPYAFGSSDGLFNLGSALSFVQVLPPGVYVAMNGQHFAWDRGAQEQDDRRVRGGGVDEGGVMTDVAALAPAVGRHDDLHGHVEAGGRRRRDQSVAGISRLRLRSGADRRGGAAHAGRAEPVRADAGRAGAAPGDRREIRALLTAPRYDPDTEVTVTSGGTEAIFDAVAAVVHPGDEVIVLEPCYDSYVPSIELNGGVPVAVPLRLPDYRIDWDAVRGRDHAAHAAADDQLAAQSDRLDPDRRRHRRADRASSAAPSIFIVSDEVYEHIIFDGAQPREHGAPSRARRAQLRRRIVRQDVSRDRVEGRLRRGAGGADGGAAQGAPVRHVQHASRRCSTRIADFLTARTRPRRAAGVLPAQARPVPAADGGLRFAPLPCRGSYFQLMDYSAISDLPDAEFAIWMTKEHGVAVDSHLTDAASSRRRRGWCDSASRRRTRRSSARRSGCGRSRGLSHIKPKLRIPSSNSLACPNCPAQVQVGGWECVGIWSLGSDTQLKIPTARSTCPRRGASRSPATCRCRSGRPAVR